jgi:hypothetical protein
MTSVVITRSRHPLEGMSLRMLGRMRRHGRLELLVVLPDGSKRLIPQAWTDQAAEEADGSEAVATLGSLADLLAVCALVDDLAGQALMVRGQADRTSPSKEESDAACPAFFDTRPAPEATGDAGRAVAGRGPHRGDHVAGRGDRQGERGGRERGGRR